MSASASASTATTEGKENEKDEKEKERKPAKRKIKKAVSDSEDGDDGDVSKTENPPPGEPEKTDEHPEKEEREEKKKPSKKRRKTVAQAERWDAVRYTRNDLYADFRKKWHESKNSYQRAMAHLLSSFTEATSIAEALRAAHDTAKAVCRDRMSAEDPAFRPEADEDDASQLEEETADLVHHYKRRRVAKFIEWAEKKAHLLKHV